MVIRLAFAVAINVDPEILLVDEALAVGDIYFRQRCLRKVHELRSRGVTILFVSHATGEVKGLEETALFGSIADTSWRREPRNVWSPGICPLWQKKDANYQAMADVIHHTA